MSIEKKSLISNRLASKKAIVTKPGVTKVANAAVTHRTNVVVRTSIPRVGVKTTAVIAKVSAPKLKNF